jgi:nitrate/nitrite transporter NarK
MPRQPPTRRFRGRQQGVVVARGCVIGRGGAAVLKALIALLMILAVGDAVNIIVVVVIIIIVVVVIIILRNRERSGAHDVRVPFPFPVTAVTRGCRSP